MASKPRLALGPSLIHLVSGMMGMRNGDEEWFFDFQNSGMRGIYLYGIMILKRGICSILVRNDIPELYVRNEDRVPKFCCTLPNQESKYVDQC